MLTLNGSGLLQQAVKNSATSSGGLPPSNISPPELVGKAEVGATVSARPGVWAGLPIPQVQTTLFVSGVARRSPCLLGPEDDGKEIIATDTASNDAGVAVISSMRGFVRHSVPHALGTPEDVSIGAYGEAVVVDAGAFFVGTSGGQWSATCALGADALQLDIDETGRITLGGGTMTGSSIVSVSYSNSGGSASAKFTVSAGDTGSAAGPEYDGSLGDLSITGQEPVEIETGLAFSGDNLTFSATGLPEGIAIDPETGRISGLTSRIGSQSVTVTATNSVGSISATFELNVVEQSRPLPDAPSYDGSLEAEQAITLGTSFDLAAGGAFVGDDLTFSATGLAPGLVIDATTGRIAGIPSSEGSFPTIVTAKNPGGETSGRFQIIVTKPDVITVEVPSYDGGLTDQFVKNNSASIDYDTSVFFSNTEGGSWSIVSTPSIEGISINESNGILTYDPRPLPEGTFGIDVIIDVNGNTATGPFSLTITPEVVAPVDPTALEPLDYDGGTDTLGPGDLPYDFSQHISGPGTATYSATGLPSGISIDSGTGVISDRGTFTGTATATVTVSNGSTINVTASVNFDDAGESRPDPSPASPDPSTVSVVSTDMVNNTNSATMNIGSDEPGRVVYVSAMVGGTEDSGLSVGGGTVTKIATDSSFTGRACDIYKVEGLTGTTAAMSWGGDTEFVSVFKVVGYRPIASSPWILDRETGGNTAPVTLNPTVPANGAALFHGKKYDGLSASPSGTVIGEASNGIRGHWINTAGSPATVNFTFTRASSNNEKYAGVLIMELI